MNQLKCFLSKSLAILERVHFLGNLSLMVRNVRIRDRIAFIWDPGHRTFIRDCPGQSGTVDTYAYSTTIKQENKHMYVLKLTIANMYYT